MPQVLVKEALSAQVSTVCGQCTAFRPERVVGSSRRVVPSTCAVLQGCEAANVAVKSRKTACAAFRMAVPF